MSQFAEARDQGATQTELVSYLRSQGFADQGAFSVALLIYDLYENYSPEDVFVASYTECRQR